MGLISWIKNKYYKSRLKKADKLVEKRELNKADTIFHKLLGKYPLAAVHLAERHSRFSSSVKEKIDALKAIEGLRSYTDNDCKESFVRILFAHVDDMIFLADGEFKSENYTNAVSLMDAARTYRNSDASFNIKFHRCHAYMAFTKFYRGTKPSQPLLAETIAELKAYHFRQEQDIRLFVEKLVSQAYFARAVKLLNPFVGLNDDFKKMVVDNVVAIISGKDKDVTKPKHISDFCENKKLCVETAKRVFLLSKSAAQKGDYLQSVQFDNFAAEFLSDDNLFNVVRCGHIFKELKSRAKADDIKKLMERAAQLKLSQVQIDNLKQDVEDLARNVSPEKSLPICRLFLTDKVFCHIYVEQAQRMAETHLPRMDSQILHNVISKISDEDSYVDMMAPFVKYFRSYVSLFVNAAIEKICRKKSLSLLEKYWKVKEDVTFFNRLITIESEMTDDVVKFVLDRHQLFLHDSAMLTGFLYSIDSLHREKFAFETVESLFVKGCNTQDFYLKKANVICDTLSKSDALELIDHVLNTINFMQSRQSSWIPLYLRKRELETENITTVSQKAEAERQSIETIIGSEINISTIHYPEYFNLWRDYIDLSVQRAKEMSKQRGIDSLLEIRNFVYSCCKDYPVYTSLKETLTLRIVKNRWDYGRDFEKNNEYGKAISQYQAILNESENPFRTRAEFRFLICHVKSKNVSENIEEQIEAVLANKSYESLKDDLAYRFVCLLLKTMRPVDAERMLNKYLPHEKTLASICKNIIIKESEQKLKEFNSKMKAIADATMPLDEAEVFLTRFSEYKMTISRGLPDTTNKFIAYQRKVETYIIKAYFDEDKYEGALNMLMRIYPNFIEKDRNFRNVAIAALGVIETDNEDVDENTYKLAISIWLSAVYWDRLFVKSLDYTSWDDPFSFTLDASLGGTSQDDYEELPDNVNFNPPIENQNVSIRNVQERLIERAETFIRKNKPDYEKFFSDEKDALDRLIRLNMDEKCIVAAPFFAKSNGDIFASVKDAMDLELKRDYDNREDVLALGVKYGFNNGLYLNYWETEMAAEKCRNALGKSAGTMRVALTQLQQIRNFPKMYAKLKSFFSNKMNEAIKTEMDYKSFINNFVIVCELFKENDLSLTFSNYANTRIIRLLNDDRMKLRDGVEQLAKVYLVSQNDIQVRKNLEGMIAGLAKEVEMSNDGNDGSVLTSVIRKTGVEFKEAVVEGKLSAVIDKVNNDRMEKDDALKKVYELYKEYPDNARLCDNLVTLCDICIMKYVVGDIWGSQDVCNILNQLNNNKSRTFKQKASRLYNEYQQIMSQLPYDTRMLIEDSTIFSIALSDRTLNDKGMALKKGLQYYRKLSGH